MSTRAGRPFRLLVATLLTSYMLWASDPAAVARAAAGADPAWLLGATLLVLADRALMAQRWIALLCIVQRPLPGLKRLLEIFFTSTFLGTFLPASVGGDAVRAYSLSRDQVPPADAVASVLMDRLLGVASLLVMSVAGLLIARDLASDGAIVVALALTGVLCALAVLTIFSERAGAAAARLAAFVPIGAVQQAGSAVVGSVRRYARHHGQLLGVLASSLAVQVLRVIQAYCLGRGLGIEAGVAVYFAFIPLILLIMLLPVTINGLGTAQLAFVWFFARSGVGAAPAFTLSLLFVGLGIIGNVPGALIYALKRPAAGQRSGSHAGVPR